MSQRIVALKDYDRACFSYMEFQSSSKEKISILSNCENISIISIFVWLCECRKSLNRFNKNHFKTG